MNLLMHTSDGRHVPRTELATIPLPERTDSYQPVPHAELVRMVETIGRDILTGYRFDRDDYGLARDGRQLFGTHTYRVPEDDQMGLTIGFRNSYDKSLSVGLAVGASVFVCDNLAFTGDLTVMRKHTSNVLTDLEDMIIATIFRCRKNYHQISTDAESMAEHALADDEAFQMLGLLFGKSVLTPRQLPIVKKEWLKPSYEDFEPRNMWSFYNACTEGLKGSPPAKIMEKHIALHQLITERSYHNGLN
ncbi:DUF932 domain-containing protein [Fidelibacter multiformis]|jgi:hypothetical protein|uniref:DUF932 domain-containing protein n=1 Tax=Fidelibacter multiformis TaxID=3377529 RepID=UPI0037DDC2F4